MLTFDKIKLVASLDAVEVVDPALFSITRENGRTKSMRISFKEPCSFSMELNYDSGEFILEFTGKILGPDYPHLISKQTIMKCFERIDEMGFCRINPAAMMTAEVVICDITKDIPIDNIPELTKWLRANISNYQSYTCRYLGNKNLIIEKNVCTHKRKKRMTIYNKEKEMALSREREFVSENDLAGEFDGLCRFELHLCSKQQIRDALGLSGNTLAEVLNSDKNPIYDFISDVIANESTRNCGDKDKWRNYVQDLVLRDCDYDPAKVEATIRLYKDPRSTSIPKMMQPFRERLAAITDMPGKWTKAMLLSTLM